MHKVLNALMASHCFSYPFSWFQGHPVDWNPPRVSMAKERKAIPWSLV